MKKSGGMNFEGLDLDGGQSKKRRVELKAAQAAHVNLSGAKKMKLMQRRPTKAIDKRFMPVLESEFNKWWQKPSIVYAFRHPKTRSRLEKLMGSNVVSLTDRFYMTRLQHMILEDYEQTIDKRIKAREFAETERVKNLVLAGKIPLDDAPPEMATHPVMLIEIFCRRLIAERRAKIKILKTTIPTHLYWDDTPDPPSGLSIEKGHVFRKLGERLCVPPDHYLELSPSEDIQAGYMFTDEEYDKLHYESDLVKQLRSCQTVEEMYALADEIIGAMLTIDDKPTAGTFVSAFEKADEEENAGAIGDGLSQNAEEDTIILKDDDEDSISTTKSQPMGN